MSRSTHLCAFLKYDAPLICSRKGLRRPGSL